MPEIGLIVTGQNGKIESCSWENYAKFISAFSKVSHKYNVMALLKANMDWIEYPDRCHGMVDILNPGQFSGEQKKICKAC